MQRRGNQVERVAGFVQGCEQGKTSNVSQVGRAWVCGQVVLCVRGTEPPLCATTSCLWRSRAVLALWVAHEPLMQKKHLAVVPASSPEPGTAAMPAMPADTLSYEVGTLLHGGGHSSMAFRHQPESWGGSPPAAGDPPPAPLQPAMSCL